MSSSGSAQTCGVEGSISSLTCRSRTARQAGGRQVDVQVENCSSDKTCSSACRVREVDETCGVRATEGIGKQFNLQVENRAMNGGRVDIQAENCSSSDWAGKGGGRGDIQVENNGRDRTHGQKNRSERPVRCRLLSY